jgi:hypothetical protein
MACSTCKTVRFLPTYARKYFYATNALYYQNKPGIPPPDEYPEILGQVIQCPNKNNDFNYQIRWLHAKSGGNWPTNLTPHLRTFFPKTELHFQLPFLINGCTYNVNRQNGPHAVEQERPARKRQKTNRTTNVVTEVVEPRTTVATFTPPPVIETTGPSQSHNFAAIYTAGSISGLSGNTDSTRSTRRRRRLTDEEVDSDDDDTVGEDNYDVDFSQNFWEARRQRQQLIEDDVLESLSDEEEEEMNTTHSVALPPGECDYGAIWQPNPNGTGRLCVRYGHDIVEELRNKIEERLM